MSTMNTVRALPFYSSPQKCCRCPPSSSPGVLFQTQKSALHYPVKASTKAGIVWASKYSSSDDQSEKGREEEDEEGEEEESEAAAEKATSSRQSLLEALDFSQVRSEKDGELLDEARAATKSGGKMNREQYGALRRKIGGTYKDFFKSYVDVDGQYVEEGWVDKTCKVCQKDTRGEPRQIDNLGRYVHVACLEKTRPGNFFTRLFSK